MRVSAPFVFTRSLRRSVSAAALVVAVSATAALSLPGTARAQVPVVIHEFSNDGANGAHSVAALIQATDGNFYGTTARGGYSNNGTVFQITPGGAFTLLFAFDGGVDGGEPTAALVQGADGNLYGVTQFGGATDQGTIFRISTAGALTTLVSLGGGTGSQPISSLVIGLDGNFYGTCSVGGVNGQGTAFQLTPAGGFTKLVDFGGTLGSQPSAALTVASDGNLYGVTQYGGANNRGTVFQLTTAGAVTTLHSFIDNDGIYPQGALSLLPGGATLYGTASTAGIYGYGTVFEITTAGAFTKLHDFDGPDGSHPEAALVLASDGVLYGTTYYGGTDQDNGTVYALNPTTGSFADVAILTRATGQYPAGPVVQGTDGVLYGTTYGGGDSDDGTVFRLDLSLPAPVTTRPAFFNGEVALGNGVYFLTLPNGNVFGYYSFLTNPNYLYHFDLGYEYVFDAQDGHGGVYLYDFASNTFFYTSPTFPFPYLYDFSLNSVLYYYADTTRPGHYTTNPRYFYDFALGRIITK